MPRRIRSPLLALGLTDSASPDLSIRPFTPDSSLRETFADRAAPYTHSCQMLRLSSYFFARSEGTAKILDESRELFVYRFPNVW